MERAEREQSPSITPYRPARASGSPEAIVADVFEAVEKWHRDYNRLAAVGTQVTGQLYALHELVGPKQREYLGSLIQWLDTMTAPASYELGEEIGRARVLLQLPETDLPTVEREDLPDRSPSPYRRSRFSSQDRAERSSPFPVRRRADSLPPSVLSGKRPTAPDHPNKNHRNKRARRSGKGKSDR